MKNKTYITETTLNYPQLFFLDEYLKNMKGAYFAGGCFKNLLNHDKAKDLDVFFYSEENLLVSLRKMEELVNTSRDWERSYQNSKVVSFIDVKNDYRLELNKSEFGSPENILNSFDFTITKFAYYSELNDDDTLTFKVMYHKDLFEHLFLKRLVLDDKILFPISTFNRSYRYNSYGYNLCRESKIKLLREINELPEIDDKELGKSLYDGVD